MWIICWTKYANSKLATFVSIIGALMRYGGVMCFFEAAFVGGIICFGIGIGIHFLANLIAKSKKPKNKPNNNVG